VTSLIYLIIDLIMDWDAFKDCIKPINMWLLVSYGLMLVSRMVHLAGSCSAAQDNNSNSEFLLNARQKSGKSKLLFQITWGVIVPFAAAWNLLGSFWLYQVMRYNSYLVSKIENHLWIMVIWQVLSYGWVAVHCRIGGVAWLLERRVRDVEDSLRQVADGDAVARWGADVARDVQDYTMLRGAKQDVAGMPPTDINALPFEEATEQTAGMECAICLLGTELGDKVRKLHPCGHIFHKPCIDLWLLRSATCPLCKCAIKAHTPQSCCGSATTMCCRHESETRSESAASNNSLEMEGPRLRFP
jgi:hypothetical protein